MDGNNREKIINTALVLVQEFGIEHTSFADIAHLSGLKKTEIETCFPNKAELSNAIVLNGLTRLKEENIELLEHEMSGREMVLNMVYASLRLIKEYSVCIKYNLINTIEIEGIRNKKWCMQNKILITLIQAIRKGQSDGSIMSTIPPKQLGVQISNGINRMLKFYSTKKGHSVLEISSESNGSIQDLIEQSLTA